ncbi:MAG: hypothetical protein J3Q66DRAFT_367593 [Benniella sp.]|nr:MAG: hypothetical protein J3Q66DRAFT_367593 [Benniella sp.]
MSWTIFVPGTSHISKSRECWSLILRTMTKCHGSRASASRNNGKIQTGRFSSALAGFCPGAFISWFAVQARPWNGSSRTRSARTESSRTLPGRTKSFWYLASRFSSFWKLPRGCGSPWRVPSGCESSLVAVEVPGSSGSSLFGLEALYSL